MLWSRDDRTDQPRLRHAAAESDAVKHRPVPGAIRVGIVGTGLGASLHLAAFPNVPDLDPITICSRHPERALSTSIDHRIPQHTTDFRSMVRDPGIDAVLIASPPHLHHPMVIAALEAGKHVLCEKPMARNLAEARDMMRLAERAGVVAMVNHQLRFLPVRARIKELVETEYLGDPHAATITVHRSSLNDPYDRPFGWLMEQEKAGGMLGAVGSHHIDTLRWWFGEVSAVAGATATLVPRRRLPDSSAMAKVDADDNFAILLRFANGALGTIHVTATAAFEGDEEISLSGSAGTLRVREGVLLGAQLGDQRLAELPIPARLFGHDAELDSLTSASPFADPEDEDRMLSTPTALLLRSWAEAIRDGESRSPSFADGVKVQELLDAVSRSSLQGRWIDTSGARFRSASPGVLG